jgi:N-acetylglucosamine kinase-like BadF-type ATPase
VSAAPEGAPAGDSRAGDARAAVLAIDGGNTKTDVMLVAADGSLLSRVRGGGSNHQTAGGRAASLAVLTELVTKAASQAGLPTGGLVAAHTSACLAGADIHDEEAELAEMLGAQGWSATTTVVNDTFAVLRAGLEDAADSHWGIGVVCGTGMNCVGVAPDGRTTRFLAFGRISGDWGGGGDLGPEALWWAARAEDGRGPETALRATVPAHFGLASVEDLVLGIYRGKIDESELDGLAPVLMRAAEHGDQVAREVVLRQASEVCAFATAAARRLGLTGEAVPVVLGGSVIAARDPLLSQAITARLAADLPTADARIVEVPPVAGAALLGLDYVGAPAAAAARLRAAAAFTP